MENPLKKWKSSGQGVICCVPECSHTQLHNGELKFYSFPNREWETERKKVWICRVRREPGWLPTKFSRICSAHFVNGIRSNDPREENYNPSIFPWKKEKESDVKRRNRLSVRIKRRLESNNIKNDAESDVNRVALPTELNVSEDCLEKTHEISVQTDDCDYEEFQDVTTLYC